MANYANILPLYENSYKENFKNAIFLKKARKLKVKLHSVLSERRSSRFFNGISISEQDFSDFLFYSAGVNKREKIKLGNDYLTKNNFTYPSGGGMYSIKIFLIIYHVKGIKPGVYIYQPVSHSLLFYSGIVSLDNFIITKRYDNNTGTYQKIENQDPSFLICCMNNFSQQRIKYGELSLALAYTDCGCLLQNFGLMAAALDLNFCIWAGFKKNEAEKALNIDGLDNHIIMTALVGDGK